MKFIISDQRGNIAVAMVLAVIAVMSGLSLTSVSMRSVIGFGYDYDSVQEMHFLRSEAARTKAVSQITANSPVTYYTPIKYVTMSSTNMKKTYTLKSLVQQQEVVNELGLAAPGYVCKSLITGVNGAGQNALLGRKSIVRKYGEYAIKGASTFAGFMYFTDNESSTNDTPVYFWGPDVLYQKTHSNSDIWIKNGGGGTNGGWPTFWGPVTTSGVIRSASGTPPYESVFRAGYTEGVYEYEFPSVANTLRATGRPHGEEGNRNKLFLVNVNGGGWTGWTGNITEPRRSFSDVWTTYPPPVDSLYRNNYSIQDTVWSFGLSGTTAGVNFFHNRLFIEGEFAGQTTFGCADTLYLIGDIKLNGTPLGDAPDTPGQMNRSDVVGLVSEKSIVIKYGYRNPADSLRLYPNCGADGSGINIYAAMCALGQGTSYYSDGVFTFEYQHPHPSVPSVRRTVDGISKLFTNIDLHRRRFPQTGAEPWPPNIDYPWYNPLWPERQPYMERGTINIWGSVSQRRRGFVHRSVLDGEHPSNGVWNQPFDYCGGTSAVNYNDPVLGIQMNTRNYPGATGSGVGYKKNYHFDNRFMYMSPPSFPEAHIKGGANAAEAVRWILKNAPTTI